MKFLHIDSHKYNNSYTRHHNYHKWAFHNSSHHNMGVAYQDHNGMAPHHDPRSIPYNTSQTQPGKPALQVQEPAVEPV